MHRLTNVLVPFLRFLPFMLPINVAMLSDYCQVVVMFKAQIQCATGLRDQLFESVCSNVYIVYQRLNITSSSYFLIRGFISCYIQCQWLYFVILVFFCLPGMCNYRRPERVKFDLCKCLVNFVVNFVVLRKRISSPSYGFPVLSTCVLTAVFQVNLRQPVPPRFSFSTCSGRESLGMSGRGIFMGRMSFQPTVSKHWMKHKAPTRLASSFLHPPWDSWWKRRCSIFTGSEMPVPKFATFLFARYKYCVRWCLKFELCLSTVSLWKRNIKSCKGV